MTMLDSLFWNIILLFWLLIAFIVMAGIVLSWLTKKGY